MVRAPPRPPAHPSQPPAPRPPRPALTMVRAPSAARHRPRAHQHQPPLAARPWSCDLTGGPGHAHPAPGPRPPPARDRPPCPPGEGAAWRPGGGSAVGSPQEISAVINLGFWQDLALFFSVRAWLAAGKVQAASSAQRVGICPLRAR